MESMIRLLRADEIECRVAMINERGASLLLLLTLHTGYTKVPLCERKTRS